MSRAPEPERIEELFARALEREPADRAIFLESECAAEPELRRIVGDLIAAHEGEGAEPQLDPTRAARLLAAAHEPPDGRRVGPYRLLGELGRGGMGTVHLAERVEGGFEQRVALKLLHPGLDTAAFLERFRRERQILARLEHPGIARLLDGGVADDGRPYFAMEYVDGVPLTDFADRRALGIAARLELLVEVCDAVEQAHRALVVHRDLKPSNILVGADGKVKLVDFGIAKLLATDEESEGKTAARPSTLLLTPDYAAPEQIRGEPITTATDVYGLGVVLYELLTGALPYGGPLSTPELLVRAVCEDEPPPPSAAALKRGDEKLARRLRGDLDTIVLAALEKEPRRRYASARALRQDIESYLAGRPVAARRPTLVYRCRKFVGRHAAGVAVAAATAAMAAILIVGFTLRLARERDQTRLEAERAELRRIEAERLRGESEEVVRFLVELFATADPDRTRNTDVGAVEILRRGAEHLESRLTEQPLVRARLLDAIGRILQHLGEYDESRALLEESLAVRREAPESGPLEIAESLKLLGDLDNRQGRFREGRERLERAVALRRIHLGTAHPRFGAALHSLANSLIGLGRFGEAEPLVRTALDIARRSQGDSDVAQTATTLGRTLEYLGRFAEAREVLAEAVAIWEAEDAEHPLLHQALSELAAVHGRLGEHRESAQLFSRALALREAVVGPRHSSVSWLVNNLAIAYQELGEHAEAERLYRRALATAEATVGPDHPQVASTLGNLGNCLAAHGAYAEALPHYRRAQAILEARLGAESPASAQNQNNLGETLVGLARHREAEAAFASSLRVFQSTLGERHLYVSWPALNLARLRERAGDLGGAEQLYVLALEIRAAALPPTSPERIEAATAFAGMLRSGGRADEATRVETAVGLVAAVAP